MDYRINYKKNGFVKFPLLNKEEVEKLRVLISSRLGAIEFYKRQYIMPSDLIKYPELYEVLFNEKLVEKLKIIFGKNVKYVPDFLVQANQYEKYRRGWHFDSQSEGSAPHIRDKDYLIGKVGIYLQDNTEEFGGGIDILKMGYKLFPSTTNSIFNRILIKLYRRIDWNIFGGLFGRSLPIKAGDCVIFDSRLPHTGTVPKNYGNFTIPEEKVKNVIYMDVGDRSSTKKYLNHNFNRAAISELRINGDELYWADYLRLKYPEDYPLDFIEMADKCGIQVESLNKQECELWKYIYSSHNKNKVIENSKKSN